MTKRILLVGAVASALSLYGGLALAEDQERVQEQVQIQEQAQEQIYGSQLMNEQERDEYHAKMREAKSVEEQEQIRWEHHELMKERASELGVTIPDEPPARGGGMGPAGGGMGRGGGMGPGGGRGR